MRSNRAALVMQAFGGVDWIETLYKQDKYEVLSWNGMLHNPKPSTPKAKNRNPIFVGADEKSHYVNHKPLEMITADALQQALLDVARTILKNEKRSNR